MSELIITIPHYNNPQGLLKTIDSIDEEFSIDIIIVDDGSDDKPNELAIIKKYDNGKITFQYLEENQGVGIAANKCLDFVKKKQYKYAARLDAGDKCYKNKFKKQIDFLEKNPEIKLLGTWAKVIDNDNKHLFTIKHPIDNNKIKKYMYLNSMFVNPTVVFNTCILKVVPGYPEKYRFAAQDYAFFFKVINNFKCANLPEVLLDYVSNENSISTTKRKLQVKNRIKIILENFKPGFYPIYGLFRSCILYFFSRSATTLMKKKLV